MIDKPPLTPAEHIARAKAELTSGAEPGYATAHALIAIAELMAINMAEALVDATARGAMATAEALGTVLGAVNPGTDVGLHCVICAGDCDASGLCDAHKFDEQLSGDSPDGRR